MKRRAALAAAAFAGAPLALRARTGARRRIGILTPALQQQRAAQLIEGLGELGWREGENLTVELRVGEEAPLLDKQAAELVRQRVDVIVALLTPAVLAARRATASVPIVMAGAAIDPVASGLVRSLAAPAGNVTGITVQGAHLAGKSLELVNELRPVSRRMGLLANATDPFTSTLLDTMQQAARSLSIELHITPVHDPRDYAAAFAGWRASRVDAVFVQPSLAIDRAAVLALQHRLPSFSFVRSFASAGGLLSYAASVSELARRSVAYIDRILRGANPGQLPVEQSNTFDVLLNLRTAKALGLTVPRALMLRVTEVIE